MSAVAERVTCPSTFTSRFDDAKEGDLTSSATVTVRVTPLSPGPSEKLVLVGAVFDFDGVSNEFWAFTRDPRFVDIYLPKSGPNDDRIVEAEFEVTRTGVS